MEPVVWISVLAIHTLLGLLLAWTCSKTGLEAHWIPFAQLILSMAGLEAALGIYLRRKIIYQIGMATLLISIPILPHGIISLWLVWRGMARHPDHWK